MKVFLITNNGRKRLGYCTDVAMVVVAKDALHAERCARWKSNDFRKAKLKVEEIDLSDTAEERVILIDNTGA